MQQHACMHVVRTSKYRMMQGSNLLFKEAVDLIIMSTKAAAKYTRACLDLKSYSYNLSCRLNDFDIGILKI